jgi:PhzF family phenazine biosynthesis protein
LQLPLYQVDAFTSELFHGNPAAVCPLDAWPDEGLMQRIAMENQLSETAFVGPGEGGGLAIRWFTPTDEVDLCGHATLAAGHVWFEELGFAGERLVLGSASGELTVEREGGRLVLDFPARPAGEPVEAPALLAALGLAAAREVRPGAYWTVVVEDEAAVRALRPDMAALAAHEPVIVTAPGESADFVSRFFCPGWGVDEDPVTGSAHCTTAPYWAERLGRSELVAHQLSARGGTVHCEVRGERVRLGGECALYLRGTIEVPGHG